MINAKPALSYSRISTFEKCPAMFEFQYIRKIPQGGNDPMDLGAALHEFFEVYGKHCVAGKVSTDLGFLDEATEQTLKSLKKPLPTRLHDDFNRMARKFVDAESYDIDNVYGVEEGIAFNKNWKTVNWFGGSVAFRMKMDRLDWNEEKKVATIIDYKTGYGEGDPFQMETYAVGVSKILRAKKVNVWFFYVGTGFIAKRAFDWEDIPKIQDKLESVSDKITNTTKFKATPGDACRYCSYVSKCPAVISSVTVAGNLEEAKELAKDVALLDARAKEKKAALRAYVVQNGTVEADNVRAEMSRSESFELTDLGAFVVAMKEVGKDPNPYLGISATVLKGLVKGKKAVEGLWDLLENHINVKVTERFSLKKPSKKEMLEQPRLDKAKSKVLGQGDIMGKLDEIHGRPTEDQINAKILGDMASGNTSDGPKPRIRRKKAVTK